MRIINKILLSIVLLLLMAVSFYYCFWVQFYGYSYPLFSYLSLFMLQGSASYLMVKLFWKDVEKKALFLGNILPCLYFIFIRQLIFLYYGCSYEAITLSQNIKNIISVVMLHSAFCIIYVFIWNELKKRDYIS